jgi:hypothetical protein
MKIFAVTCNPVKLMDTLVKLKSEPGVYIVKVEKLSEFVTSLRYSSDESIIIFRIMDEETEVLLRLKYPPGTFIDCIEA